MLLPPLLAPVDWQHISTSESPADCVLPRSRPQTAAKSRPAEIIAPPPPPPCPPFTDIHAAYKLSLTHTNAAALLHINFHSAQCLDGLMTTSVTGTRECLWGLVTEWRKRGMEMSPHRLTENRPRFLLKMPPFCHLGKKRKKGNASFSLLTCCLFLFFNAHKSKG